MTDEVQKYDEFRIYRSDGKVYVELWFGEYPGKVYAVQETLEVRKVNLGAVINIDTDMLVNAVGDLIAKRDTKITTLEQER